VSAQRVLTIAGKSLRRIARDRSTLFFTILLPFFIILVVGLSIGGFNDNSVPVGFVRHGSGPLTDELARKLDGAPALEVREYSDVDKMRKDVRRGAIVAGVEIPSGYDAAVRSGKGAEVVFLADLSRGFPSVVRSSVNAAVAEQGARLQAARFATQNVGRTFDQNLAEAKRVEAFTPIVGVRSQSVGEKSTARLNNLPNGFEYTAPANLVLFVFITSFAGSAALIESRRLGVSRRMLATPTSAAEVLAGEALGRFAIAFFQAIYIVLLGILVFGVKFGDPLGAAVLVAVFALVATSFAMLAGAVFRTPEQAGSIGPIAGIAMGMLAGCMWPRFIMPTPMQRLGQLFPQSWAMDAWIKLIADGAGLRGILPQLAVLGVFVAILLPLSTWRLRRSIVA
jgi:linearmycin/streptolysin S transport system permease protein